MTKKQQEIIEVLSSNNNVRNEEKIKWRNNIMQDNIAVLNTILQLIKENIAYQKPNAIYILRGASGNSIMMSPYTLNLILKYEINRGTKGKQGLELLRLLKLQACRKASNTSLTTQTSNTSMV